MISPPSGRRGASCGRGGRFIYYWKVIAAFYDLKVSEKLLTFGKPQKTPENHVCKCGDKFILKEDLNAVEDKIQDVMCRLSDIEEKYGKLTAKQAAKTTKKTEDE